MRPRCATWWLCLLIALLPIRGLAHGWMVVADAGRTSVLAPMGSATVTATVTAAIPDASPAATAADHAPCHAATVSVAAHPMAGADGHDTAERDGAPSPHVCGLCDLCHSPLARAADPVWAWPAPAADDPRAAPGPAAPDAPGAGIFRPPRA